MQEETEMAAAIAARERVEEAKHAHQEVERKTKEMEVAATARKQDEEKERVRQQVGRKAAIHLTTREEKNGKYARIQEEHTREKHVHNLTNTQDYLLHISDSVDEPEHIAPHTSKELEKPILQLSLVNDNCKWDNSKRHVLEAVMVVQQGIRCRVMAAWRCTAGREEQTRMHLLSEATRIARHCDIKYAFNALLLNRRVSSLQHAQLDKDYEPWKPVHDSRQFQSAVRQLSTPHDAHPTDNITSPSSSRELLSRVQADLAITEMGQQWRDSCCPYCYGIFDEQDHVTRHTSQCCYNPNFNTDNWAQRWRCEHCSEVYELYEQACSHEMVCLFQSGHKI